ncbi:hypothetical protein QQF64_013250 [Cirrhinus molitorella]|uniref:Protein kinase domain-containing protein n=1 Tax=Cirrhinus molitorella TaxID=172907 RepID=A0ABR3LTW0_9TELE
MVQRHSRREKTEGGECVHGVNPGVSLTPTDHRAEVHPRSDETPECVGEGGGQERGGDKAKKKRKRLRRFTSFFSCLSRPKSTRAQDEQVEQGEVDQDTDEAPSRCTDDQISLQDVVCTVEKDDHQEPPTSVLEVLTAADDQQMVDDLPQDQDGPASPSAGESASHLLRQLDCDKIVNIEGHICWKYAIAKKMGEGSYGSVYEGTRCEDSLQVAVKITAKTENEPYLSLVKRPSHCMDMYDFWLHYDGLFSEGMARHFMQQVIDAAVVCCTRGVLHRDIKMPNLLVNIETLEVKLIYFGCGDPPEEHIVQILQWSPLVLHDTSIFPESTDIGQMDIDTWSQPGFSDECICFIRGCLKSDPERRFYLEELLIHNWFKNLQRSERTKSKPPQRLPDMIPFQSCPGLKASCPEHLAEPPWSQRRRIGMTMYAVVTLQDSDEVMVAPSNWLSEDKKHCYWPPFKSTEKYLEAVNNCLEPSTGGRPWEKLTILFHSEYGTYEQAKEKRAAMIKEKERPVKPKKSQSALSGMSTHGIKRKRETCDLHTSAKLDPDMSILKCVKQIMADVKIRIQNINSTVQITTEQKNNILDVITKMNDMDKDNKRKETFGVFGKTGEGKSSLLNAILGFDILLPSGCFGACTSVITQVEANQTDSNYTADIELISKEEWENEIAAADTRNKERINAVYGADADKKTLEELKKDDKYAEIDNLLSAMKKTISHTDSSEFKDDVECYIQHNELSFGDLYWPLVKSVTIKIPDCHELLEHIVLLDLPGTGDCNKIRDDLWKTKLRECSSVWVVSNINRAITDKDPWGIIQHCIQDLGPGGECRNINFICTRTDDISPNEYLRSAHLSGDEISVSNLKTVCILHRNNRAKKTMKKKFENLEYMKSKGRFITDVFTVSSKAYFEKNLGLEPIETEIPKLQDVLKNSNRRINRELIRDYVNEAKGVLSFIQSIQLDTDEKMVEIKGIVRKKLEENLAEALKKLDCQFDSLYKIMKQCLSKGVEKSVKLCVDTKNKMIKSAAPKDKRGFHKTLQAVYKNKGRYWPKNLDAPLDVNMCLAKHMHDNLDAEFNLIFPVDANKTGMSVQEQIDKFSIIQSGTDYSSSSMLYHMENFIKTEEIKVKALLKRVVVHKKKKIYASIQTTIQNQMTAGYEQAAKLKGNNAMKKREKKITKTIELLKYSMFEDAKTEVLNRFKNLMEHICKTLESELKRSVEHSLSQTTKTTLMDVSSEIEKLERLSRQLSD